MHTREDSHRGAPAHGPGRCVRAALVILVGLAVPALLPDRTVRAGDRGSASSRTYKVLLDLTRKNTYVPIPGSADRTRIGSLKAEGLPSRYRLVPAAGTVRYGQAVDIVLDGSPDVCIRVSLVTRGRELAVRISPLIGVDGGDPLEFTQDRIKRTVWSLHRQVKDLQRQLSAARQEYQRIETWLATPGNKSLELHKAVRLRQKLVAQQIAACQRELPVAERRFAAMRAIIELAAQIDATAEIRFTVEGAE